MQQGLDALAPRGGVGREAVDVQRLADDVGDRQPRIQRAVRILENHLEPAPARAQFRPAQAGDVLALEHNAAGGRLDELDDRASERGLAAAAFAHQPDRFARRDGEAHVIHGADEFLRPAKQTAAGPGSGL